MVATKTLPAYSHQFSPQKFTQPQLFVCLILKFFFKTDYRGITEILRDSPELCKSFHLTTIPHFTTLQKAATRILNAASTDELLRATVAVVLQDRKKIELAAIDATGLECGHISPYFLERCHNGKIPHRNTRLTKWPKLAIIADTKTHLILTALSTYGPCSDCKHFKDALQQLPRDWPIETLLADAGYDSEKNHILAREYYGIKTVIPPKVGCPRKTLPRKKYRREMAMDFDHDSYRQRQQVETVMSMIKRNLGDSLRNHSEKSRNQEMHLLAITHNLMVILLCLKFSQSFSTEHNCIIEQPVLGLRSRFY